MDAVGWKSAEPGADFVLQAPGGGESPARRWRRGRVWRAAGSPEAREVEKRKSGLDAGGQLPGPLLFLPRSLPSRASGWRNPGLGVGGV